MDNAKVRTSHVDSCHPRRILSTLPNPTDYDCTQCGACCRCFPIFASAADAAREPRIARETREREAHLQTADQTYQLFPLPFLDQCAFLQANQLCQIYTTRPAVCRRFEGGSAQCIEARQRVGVKDIEA